MDGYVAAPVLLGSAPRHQGEDSIDGRTLRVLLEVSLLKKQEEEEARAGGGGARGSHAGARPSSA